MISSNEKKFYINNGYLIKKNFLRRFIEKNYLKF